MLGRLTLFSLFVILLCGCGSTSPYGFSRVYEPNNAERDFGDISPHPYHDVAGRYREFEGVRGAWFGVVTHVRRHPEGQVLRLEYRKLRPRNLCRAREASSCRTTVSAKSQGEFWVATTETRRFNPGDLLRALGRFENGRESLPQIRADVIRHWPRAYFVTSDMHGRMRR